MELIAEETIERWLPVIEGKGKWEKVVESCPKVASDQYGMMAQCFENMTEATTTTGGVGNYSPILIPMVRRMMPSLIGMDIFGTQPMTGPSGLIFALRAEYQNDNVNPIKASTPSFIVTVGATTDGGANDATVGGDISFTNDDAGADPVEVVIGKIRHIEGYNILVEDLGTGTGGYEDLVLTADVATAGTMFAATCVQAQTIATAATYANEALFKIIFSNYTGTYTTAVGEALGSDTKEMGFNIDSSTITAKSRKLKTRWTKELEDDLKAVHKIDAESLLTGIASDEITMEMNREFMALVNTKAIAGGVTAWTYAGADGRWEVEKYMNLVATISRVRRQVAIANRRGQATFMIVSPGVLSALETAGKLDRQGDSISQIGVDPVRTAYVGNSLGMKCYVDIWATTDFVNLGYKGNEEVDAGIYYAPYIPLQIDKGYGEEDNVPRTFFRTRYGVADNIFGAENYYRQITVAGLPT